jgi:hypothetical protein
MAPNPHPVDPFRPELPSAWQWTLMGLAFLPWLVAVAIFWLDVDDDLELLVSLALGVLPIAAMALFVLVRFGRSWRLLVAVVATQGFVAPGFVMFGPHGPKWPVYAYIISMAVVWAMARWTRRR